MPMERDIPIAHCDDDENCSPWQFAGQSLQKCPCQGGVAQNPTSRWHVLFRQKGKRNDHTPTLVGRCRWIAKLEMPGVEVGVGFELLAIWLHHAHATSAILPARLGNREVR